MENQTNVFQSLLDMEVHATKQITPSVNVIRVPGGWIYRFVGTNVFVPEPRVELTQHIVEVEFDNIPLKYGTPEDYAEGARERAAELQQEIEAREIRLKHIAARIEEIKAEEAALKEPKTSGPEDMEEDVERSNGIYIWLALLVAFLVICGFTYGGYIFGYSKGIEKNSSDWQGLYDKQKSNLNLADSIIKRQGQMLDEQSDLFLNHWKNNH